MEILPFKAFMYLDIRIPFVALEVSKGVIISPDLLETENTKPNSLLYSRIIIDADDERFNNEFLIETYRSLLFSRMPSRLNCLYCFESYDHALQAQEWGGHFNKEYLSEVIVVPKLAVKLDSNWLNYATRNEFGMYDKLHWDYFKKYWKGLEYIQNKSLIEILFYGKAIILNRNLIQNAEIISKNNFPNATDFINLSIIAERIHSNFGRLIILESEMQNKKKKFNILSHVSDFTKFEFAYRLFLYDQQYRTNFCSLLKTQISIPDLSNFSREFEVDINFEEIRQLKEWIIDSENK